MERPRLILAYRGWKQGLVASTSAGEREDPVMIERFHDFYGCHANIIRKRNHTYDLFIRMGTGKLLYKSNYQTYKGARIGMSKWSDCWEKSFC